MCNLTIIKQNGGAYIDSREVAEIIGKRHCHLLRDIDRYISIMEDSIETNFGFNDFFLESSYIDGIGRTQPCYLVSKMGCEMIASKLTGEKGVLFTALYVAKFNVLEASERQKSAAIQVPRLGEYNACARIVVRALKNSGATSGQIVDFLKGFYQPLGLKFAQEAARIAEEEIPEWYSAKEIAEINGVYSRAGKPHAQAVAAILNDNLFIDKSHKSTVMLDCGDCLGVGVRYDDYAVEAVEDWIIGNGCPSEICGNGRTYHVLYDFQIG